jgi:putative ABC transport system permease protein
MGGLREKSHLAVTLYGAALRLLPPTLRREYGVDMIVDFRRSVSPAGGQRVRPVFATVRAVADVVMRAPAEWRAELRSRGRAVGGKGRLGAGGPFDGFREFRIAVRALWRRPGFTIAAVSTLGLGIGATVALWTIVESVLLRPLPYSESNDILTMTHAAPGMDLPADLENSAGTVLLYRQRARTVTDVAVMDDAARNVTGGGEPVRMSVQQVTPEFFDVLRIDPAMGRRFYAEDAVPGPVRVAILTDASWRAHFGGDRDVIGRTIRIDGEPAQVVGVMPPGFIVPESREAGLLLPLWLDEVNNLTTFGLTGLMRLAPGATLEMAQEELSGLQMQLPEIAPGLTAELLERTGWSVNVERYRDRIVRSIAPTLWILLAVVGLVLLIAFANVANLILVRAESRRQEMAIRAALGAGRRSVAGMFLVECVLLGLAGGAVGVALAWATVRLVVARGPEGLPRLAEVSMDGSVLAMALLLSLSTGFLLGLVPLGRRPWADRSAALREGGLRATAHREGRRTRSVLIAGQVAMALVLLVFAGLLIRSSLRLARVDPGISTTGVLAVGVSRGAASTPADAAMFYQRVLDEARTLPGVIAIGAGNYIPFLEGNLNGTSFRIESRPREEDQLPVVVMYGAISEGYFDALGMRILEGRNIVRADHERRAPVVWINETFARRYLDGAALGERIRFGPDTTFLEIAGVVNDVRTFGLDEEVRPMAYLPMNTSVGGASTELMQFAVRLDAQPAAFAAALRGIVARLDSAAPLTNAVTLEDAMRRSLAERSFVLLLLGIAAGAALLLGVVGLYGVISYVVAQRTREIGVRIALGADVQGVRAWVLRQGLALVATGIVAGLFAAAATTRLLQSLLYDVDARDPVTFLAVTAVLLAVGAAATWVPAMRASRISPLEALRAD